MYTLTQLEKLIAEYVTLTECPSGNSYADKMEHRIAQLKLQLYLTEYQQVTGKRWTPKQIPARTELPTIAGTCRIKQDLAK